jgi:protoheme IX farnesyltransferase
MVKNFFAFRDYIALSKPRISFFCVIMAAGGLVLSPENVTLFKSIIALLGIAFAVASANALNMIYEKDTDKLMLRTRLRPLASGRIHVVHAVFFAVVLWMISAFLLIRYVNFLTALLASLAILGYSFLYTPLKFKTPLALVVGAVPGAMPPLLGWTAANNRIDLVGIILFLILFTWQMPHFIAIAIYHKQDYARAGIRVVSLVRGDRVAKRQAFLWTICLFFMSMLLIPLKVAGVIYFLCVFLLGVWFLYLSFLGLKKHSVASWPRRFFVASLVYLPLLVLALVVDRFFILMFGM